MRIVLVNMTFLIVCLFLPHAAQSEDARPILRIGVDVPYPPFAERDVNGRLFGFDIDIMNAICDELEYSCQYEIMPFTDLLEAVADGRIDAAIAGLGPTEERKKVVDFSTRYFRSQTIFIERAGEFRDVTRESVKGRRLGVQVSTLQETYLRDEFGDVAAIVTAPDFTSTLALLASREADLVLVDGLPGYVFLKTDAGAGFEVAGRPVSSDKVLDTASIAVGKNNPELLEAINEAIEAIRRNGEYGKINRRYFDFTIY